MACPSLTCQRIPTPWRPAASMASSPVLAYQLALSRWMIPPVIRAPDDMSSRLHRVQGQGPSLGRRTRTWPAVSDRKLSVAAATMPTMDVFWMFALLGLGGVVGAALGYLYARGRLASMTADLTGQARAAEERARSAQDRAAIMEHAAQERAALIDGQLAERFQAMSAQALDRSATMFLEIAEGRLSAANAQAAGELETRRAAVEHLVQPLRDTLAKVEDQLRQTEEARHLSHAALTEQMKITRQSSEDLRAQTQALVTALRRPEARGRWGEMQLRRVVELSGMAPRCDFDEQVSVQTAEGTFRPDMVVRLAGGKNIVVDSKVSLAAYLEAAETSDEGVRAARLDAHARHLRQHVDQLAAKSYWATLSPAPEFVVLFIPGEAFLAPALEHDPALLEHAMARKVHIATPTTLVTMLRTAQYAWQQDALAENARAAFDLGRELYERISSLGRNMDRLGHALSTAVTTYNQTVGSLESRVLVSARRLSQLGVVEGDLETPALIEEATRTLSAPELAAPGRSVPELPAADLAAPEAPAGELPVTEPAAPELAAPAELNVPPQPDSPNPGPSTAYPPEPPHADESPGAAMAIPGRNGAAG
jgi:DNA recombination protein RmuC